MGEHYVSLVSTKLALTIPAHTQPRVDGRPLLGLQLCVRARPDPGQPGLHQPPDVLLTGAGSRQRTPHILFLFLLLLLSGHRALLLPGLHASHWTEAGARVEDARVLSELIIPAAQTIAGAGTSVETSVGTSVGTSVETIANVETSVETSVGTTADCGWSVGGVRL